MQYTKRWIILLYAKYLRDETDNLDVDFCLRAVGDSMIGARIYDGDIVFVRKQSTVSPTL